MLNTSPQDGHNDSPPVLLLLNGVAVPVPDVLQPQTVQLLQSMEVCRRLQDPDLHDRRCTVAAIVNTHRRHGQSRSTSR